MSEILWRSVEGRLTRLEMKMDRLLEQMARSEERQRLSTALWGSFGGAIPAVSIAIYWILT